MNPLVWDERQLHRIAGQLAELDRVEQEFVASIAVRRAELERAQAAGRDRMRARAARHERNPW